tara:strand:+ start:1245 stop:1640 length:396 start_codon:yes stop_codon:yes gene_type:complete
LWDNFDLLQLIPPNLISYKGDNYLVPSKCKKNTSVGTISFRFKGPAGRSIVKSIGVFDAEKNIGEGEVLGKIIDLLQKMHPVKVFEFECKIFDTRALNGLGIKYVGFDPLSISKLWARVDNKWIDARNLLV